VLAGDLARELEGRLDGEDREITAVAPLETAGIGDLSYLSAEKYSGLMETTGAGTVLVDEGFEGETAASLIRVSDPYASLRQSLILLYPPEAVEPGIQPTALIHPSVALGENLSIGPYTIIDAEVTIGDGTVIGASVTIGREVRIGSNCVIHPGVVIYRQSLLGDRVELLANAVIGSDGFGHSREEGIYLKIPQVGRVVLEDDVLVGACSTIDRATFGETRVEAGTKIDNLVMVAHNSVIGPNTAIAAQTGMAGSTIVGGEVQIGGQVGLAGHLKVGDRAVLAAKSGVISDIPEDSYYFGYPARPQREWMTMLAGLRRLPDLRRQVRELERRLAELEDQVE